jgi:hypothetical protein
MININYLKIWRERVGIEPTEDVSTTPPTGFEVQAHHQAQAAPTEYIILSQPTELVHKTTIDNISPKGRLLN